MRDTDKRIKEIEKANAYQGIGMAQNELASLAQEQKANLLQEKQILTQQAQERATIAQAAEMGVGAVADLTQQAAVPQAAPAMNAQTQQILSKYGINPSQKTAPTSTTVTRNTSRQGSTTVENITNTTTTNRNVVKIVQPNIPVSQPNIALRQGAVSNAKFKAWLQKASAKQEEMALEQQNDYNRRERSLTRSTNMMLRKIQDLSKTVGEKLNPENMVNSLSGGLKTLLFLYITAILPVVWKPLMNTLDSLEADFRRFFGLNVPGDLKGKSITGGKVDSWKKALGIPEEDKDGTSIFGGLYELIKSSFKELQAKMLLQKEDREKAIERLSGDKPKKVTDFSGWVRYLGNIIAAVLGGSEGQAQKEGDRVSEKKLGEIKEEEFEVGGRKVSLKGEFDKYGDLKDEDSALKMTQYLGTELNKDTVDINKVQASVQKLREFSREQNKLIPITPEIAKAIGKMVPAEEYEKIKKEFMNKGEYKINDTDYVYTLQDSEYNPNEKGSGISDELFTDIGGVAGKLTHWSIEKGIEIYRDLFSREGRQPVLTPKSSMIPAERELAEKHPDMYPKARVEMVSENFLNRVLNLSDKNAFSSENTISLKTNLESKGKKTVLDKRHETAVNEAAKLSDSLRRLDTTNTYDNRAKGTANLEYEYQDDMSSKEQAYQAKMGITPKTREIPIPPTDSVTDSKEITTSPKSPGNVEEDERGTARKIIDFLRKRLGLTDQQAAGVAGNLYVESSFNLGARGDRSTSFGLAQWHNERKQALFKYTGTSESNPPTLEQQLEFLAYELENTEKAALVALRNAKTVKDSSLVFAEKFERPATGADGLPLHFDRRWGAAKEFYASNQSQRPDLILPDVVPTKTSASSLTDIYIAERGKEENLDHTHLEKISSLTGELAMYTKQSAELDKLPRQQTTINVTSPETDDYQSYWSSKT